MTRQERSLVNIPMALVSHNVEMGASPISNDDIDTVERIVYGKDKPVKPTK